LNDKLPSPLRGVVTATITPLRDDGTLDEAGLERLIEHLIGGGVHGLFILGTTGEAPALPYSVRIAVIKETCKLAGNRVPVMVGITDTSYKESIDLAARAYEAGAMSVVAAPPYYYRVNQADLLHYFADLASQVPIPLFLYNAPLNTHHSLEVETVIRAAEEPNIMGLKDSSLNMGYFHMVRAALRDFPAFNLLVGPDDLLAEAVLLGAHGGMAAGSNVWPALFVALYEAAAAGNLKGVAALHQQVLQFDAATYLSADYQANPLRGLKCALSLIGICGSAVARPLRPYSNAERAKVLRYLEGVDVCSTPQLSGAAS